MEPQTRGVLFVFYAESADPRSPSRTSEAPAGRWLVGCCWKIPAHVEKRVRFSGIVGLFHLHGQIFFFKKVIGGLFGPAAALWNSGGRPRLPLQRRT